MVFLNKNKLVRGAGEIDGLAVKNTGYSHREPRFDSQHLYSGSHCNSYFWGFVSSSVFHREQAHRHTCRQIIYTVKINKNIKLEKRKILYIAI